MASGEQSIQLLQVDAAYYLKARNPSIERELPLEYTDYWNLDRAHTALFSFEGSMETSLQSSLYEFPHDFRKEYPDRIKRQNIFSQVIGLKPYTSVTGQLPSQMKISNDVFRVIEKNNLLQRTTILTYHMQPRQTSNLSKEYILVPRSKKKFYSSERNLIKSFFEN